MSDVAAGPSFARSFLRRYREDILAEWRRVVRVVPDARDLHPRTLTDHIPEVLDELAEVVDDLAKTPGELATAQRHALDRLDEGFDITAVVAELSVLRGAILTLWARESTGGNVAELSALNLGLDRTIAASVARYAEERERKLAASERRSRQAVAERELALSKLEALLTAAPVGIGFVDRELRIVRINDALASINAMPAREHLGRTVMEVYPDIASELEPILRRVLETGEPALNLELDHRSPKDPKDHHALLATYFPVRSEAGAISGVGGIILDVTERKRMEEELRVALRIREELVAVVSHDLRGPLGTIQLSASLLLHQLDAEPRAQRHLDVIMRNCVRMAQLINDLLDSAKIRAGRLKLDTHRENAESVVSEAIDLQQSLAEEKGVQLVRAGDVQDADILCDRGRILQVFGNLIGNAIKFCRPGDTITLGATRNGSCIRFSVADTGPGIDAAAIPRLFDAYWSGNDHGKEGTGLGLFIVHGIVERHGGRIWVESKPGAGAKFVFTIPTAR